MLRLATDEQISGAIIRGLRRRMPDLDLVTAPEAGLLATPDPDILGWAAGKGRVLLTRDINTMKGYANARVEGGLPMPGMLAIQPNTPIGIILEAVELAVACMSEEEMQGRVIDIPIR